MVPTWLPPTIILAYVGIVILLALAGAFSFTLERRQAAREVLRLLLPWGVVSLLLERRTPQYQITE